MYASSRTHLFSFIWIGHRTPPRQHPASFLTIRAQSSAEWIAEAPYSGGILPLADFNSAFWGSDYTGQTNTCFATIGGTTGPIGLATFNPNLDQITMDTTGGTVKAAPSSLFADGTSFSIAWASPGP
jgi:hypothetical protein